MQLSKYPKKKRCNPNSDNGPSGKRMKTMRPYLMERDGYHCFYCAAPLDEATFTVDHKVPRSRGGTNALDNLVACCVDCNQKKGDKTDAEFAEYLQMQAEMETVLAEAFKKMQAGTLAVSVAEIQTLTLEPDTPNRV